jgi:hypothetical protein
MRRHLLVGTALVLGLATTPDTAFLSASLPAADAQRVRRLVRQLDDDCYASRAEADRLLRQLDVTAVPLLRQELQTPTTLELRRRLERIIAHLSQLPWTDDMPAALRTAGRDGKPVLVFSTIGVPGGFG